MNESNVNSIINFMMFSLYLFFIFLAIQIWFLWKDTDKDKLKVELFANEIFFKKNSVFIFSFMTFLFINEFLNSVHYGIFYLLAQVSIVMFVYNWYSTLKPHANRKSLPRELNN